MVTSVRAYSRLPGRPHCGSRSARAPATTARSNLRSCACTRRVQLRSYRTFRRSEKRKCFIINCWGHAVTARQTYFVRIYVSHSATKLLLNVVIVIFLRVSCKQVNKFVGFIVFNNCGSKSCIKNLLVLNNQTLKETLLN